MIVSVCGNIDSNNNNNNNNNNKTPWLDTFARNPNSGLQTHLCRPVNFNILFLICPSMRNCEYTVGLYLGETVLPQENYLKGIPIYPYVSFYIWFHFFQHIEAMFLKQFKNTYIMQKWMIKKTDLIKPLDLFWCQALLKSATACPQNAWTQSNKQFNTYQLSFRHHSERRFLLGVLF